jgi:putative Ca2+/H+ antiporter (TMEM165/GDT1 family)
MEALLFSFVAAILLAVGDRGQLLAALLAARRGQPVQVIAGILLSAGAVCAVAAYAGAALHDLITVRAQTLLIALALAYAGVLGLFAPPPPGFAARFKGGSLLTAIIFGFAFASGGRIQLLVLALAARVELPWLTAVGGTAGMVVAAIPAVLLGKDLLEAPLRLVRIAIAILFLLGAGIVLFNAPAS